MKKNEESANGFKSKFTSLLVLTITGICATLLLSTFGTVLVLSETLPSDSILYFSAFSVFVGSFISSILSSKKLGRPLYTALASGVFFLIFLFLVGALLYGRLLPERHFVFILSAILFGALLGAVFSAGKKQRKKAKK